MATQYSSNRTERCFVALQPLGALRTVATAGLQQILHQSVTMSAGNPVERQPFKTGTPSSLAGIRGRQSGGWTLTAPIIPSGTAGTAPNMDALLQSAMGAAPVTTVSLVTYGFATARKPLTIFRYDESGLALPSDQYVMGGLPSSMKISFGGPFLMVTFSGNGVGVGDRDNFAAYVGFDAGLKGGGAAYPVEPASPTTVGTTLPGWGGILSIDGSVLGECRGGLEVTFELGYEWISDGYSDPYAIAVVSGPRYVAVSNLTFINDDTTALQNVKQKAFLKTPMTVVIDHGNVVGSKVKLNLGNVQFPQGAFVDAGSAIDVQFNGATAAATSVGVQDDATIVFG